MPFEDERFVTPLGDGDEEINNVMTELCSDDSLQAHRNNDRNQRCYLSQNLKKHRRCPAEAKATIP